MRLHTASEKFKTDRPCLIVDEFQARENIRKMKNKAERNNALFRPHFKTHQSVAVGEWFRDENVSAITVSSVDMACYFAENGWNDITVAAPLNLLQIEKINSIDASVHLNIVIDCILSASVLVNTLQVPTGVFLKIDTGNRRCGLQPAMKDEIRAICDILRLNPNSKFSGFLVHSGHTYKTTDTDQIKAIYKADKTYLEQLKHDFQVYSDEELMISIGDTPGCSVVDELAWADEIRPGNFVFFDLFQHHLGVCAVSEIACVMACPVIGMYPPRNEIVIYGGAIHFSKDQLMSEGEMVFGLLAEPDDSGNLKLNEHVKLVKVWQEHGLIKYHMGGMSSVKPGDIVYVFPVHSCLTLDAVRDVKNQFGETLSVMPKPF